MEPTPLTSKAIQSSAKIDKDDYLNRYVASQRSNLASYAREGAREFKTWEGGLRANAEINETSKSVAEVRCLASPVLKARVPNAPEPAPDANAREKEKAGESRDIQRHHKDSGGRKAVREKENVPETSSRKEENRAKEKRSRKTDALKLTSVSVELDKEHETSKPTHVAPLPL